MAARINTFRISCQYISDLEANTFCISVPSMSIGSRIAARRKALGLTQPELAIRCGWEDSQGRISHYETGRRQVSISEAVTIASALETNIVELLGPHLVSNTSGDAVDGLLDQFNRSGDMRVLLAALPENEKAEMVRALLPDLTPRDAMELAQELLKHAQGAL